MHLQTLTIADLPWTYAVPEPTTAERALDHFLAAHERRALIIAELATRSRDEALDIVQDSMLAFVRRYANKPAAQWPPLFHRVVQNRIRDWHRRATVRRRLFGWWGGGGDEDPLGPLERTADPSAHPPDRLVAQAGAAAAIDAALAALPLRQQQAFLLRVWEGLDVAATAQAMGCSEGSVKTHLSRALASLRQRLEDHRDEA